MLLDDGAEGSNETLGYGQRALTPGTLTKKSGKFFRVGIFLDFVWLTTRTMHPHGAYVV